MSYNVHVKCSLPNFLKTTKFKTKIEIPIVKQRNDVTIEFKPSKEIVN